MNNLYENVISLRAPAHGPPRPGLEWRERTHRWVCPAEGCEKRHNDFVGDSSSHESEILSDESYRAIDRITSVVNAAPAMKRNAIMSAMSVSQPHKIFSHLEDTGVLKEILPELAIGRGIKQPSNYHFYDVLDHQTQALTGARELLDNERSSPLMPRFADYFDDDLGDGHTRGELTALASMLHDVGKPDTYSETDKPGHITFYNHEDVGARIIEDIADRLDFNDRSKDFLMNVVENHMRPHTIAQRGRMPTRKAVRKFKRMTGDSMPAVLLIHLADILSSRGPNLTNAEWDNRLKFVDHVIDLSNEKPEKKEALVSGRDLIDLGMKPSPEMGRILSEIEDKYQSGELRSREEALFWVIDNA